MSIKRFPFAEIIAAGTMASMVIGAGTFLSRFGNEEDKSLNIVNIYKDCAGLTGRFPKIRFLRTQREPLEGISMKVPGDEIFYVQGKFPKSLFYDFSYLSKDQYGEGFHVKFYRGDIASLSEPEREEVILQRVNVERCS